MRHVSSEHPDVIEIASDPPLRRRLTMTLMGAEASKGSREGQ
ncbi:MAG: hypothetical protein ACT6RN_26505 [Agrobacterium sp.]